MPTKDIYDTQIMAMAINAAKDMYDRGVKQMEDFNKKYGDFYSPIEKDMQWYAQNVTNPMRKLVDDLYARGIDPLRSAEGRALISRAANSIDIGTVNRLKQSASIADEYLKNKAQLESKGLYNPDLEERFLNRDLSGWSTVDNGIWKYSSPMQSKGLEELTSSWYDKRTPHSLTQKEVESFGETYNPLYQYTGYTEDDLLHVAGENVPGFNGNVYAEYQRDLAKRELIARGNEAPTEDEINRQLARNIAVANREYLIRPVKDEDKFALNNQAYAQNVALTRLKAQLDEQKADNDLERAIQLYRITGSTKPGGKSSKMSGGSGSGGGNKPEDDPLARQQDYAVANILGIPTGQLYDSNGYPTIKYGRVKIAQEKWALKQHDNFYTNNKFDYTKAVPSFMKRYSNNFGAWQFYKRFDLPYTQQVGASGESKYTERNLINAKTFRGDIYIPDDIITRTAGFGTKALGDIVDNKKMFEKRVKDVENIIPTNYVYSAMLKDGRLHNFQICYAYDGNGDEADVKFNLPENSQSIVFVDLHTSTAQPVNRRGQRIHNAGAFATASSIPMNPMIDEKNKAQYSEQNQRLSHALSETQPYKASDDIVIE